MQYDRIVSFYCSMYVKDKQARIFLRDIAAAILVSYERRCGVIAA